MITGSAFGQSTERPVTELSALTVYSPRIANQEPTFTVVTPASALRYEPAVDLQARSFAEGQADIAIRGGTFANTGFTLAGLPLYDPQTGHYYAEIPVAPGMLSAPSITTGADLATGGGWNATAGGIAYGWRPVRVGGEVSVGGGEWNSWRASSHLGTELGEGWATDFAAGYSKSDGPFANADHEISRYSARLQHTGEGSASHFLVGYQDKFFGWPNLYTPFGSPETEDIQTLLLAGTHRWQPTSGGGFLEVGAYWRRNDDNYAFNRFAPVPAIPPFQHTTHVTAAGGRGRIALDEDNGLEFRLWAIADEIDSTSLRFGRFYSRTHVTGGAYYDHRGELSGGGRFTLRSGLGYDTTNRGDDAFTPVIELGWEPTNETVWQRVSLGYSAASQAPSYTAVAGNPNGGLFRGNPNLDRATSRTLDLMANFATSEWTGSVGAFYRADDELIDWTFRNDFWARSAAAVDLDTWGFEAYAHRSWDSIDLHLGYTWLEKNEDYGGLAVDGSFYALNFPNHRFTAAVVWRVTRHFDVRLDNEFRVQEPNPLRRNSTDETWLSSVGLYYRPLSADRLELSLQIDNLWDSDFEEIPATPGASRFVAAGATWRW
ncbi:MAG: hypothetical protein SynsKO_38650 [Synoicihabitans sp.]